MTLMREFLYRGVETIVLANTSRFFPSTTIALSLIGGFMAMLIIERLISGFSQDSHDHSFHSPFPSHEDSAAEAPKPVTVQGSSHVDFDVELGELERSEGIAQETAQPSTTRLSRFDTDTGGKARAYPLTLGLIVHALADGLALGSAAVSPVDTGLSFVVFLALLIHKGKSSVSVSHVIIYGSALAPVALALTTSLLSTTLSRAECRKHLAVFSASTPIGALVIYTVLSFVPIKSDSNWTGIALLISVCSLLVNLFRLLKSMFQGGTFLYVATVLQPGKAPSDDISERARFLFLILGMLVPVGINTFLSHDH